jgi:AcrR family transcriptional regulator
MHATAKVTTASGYEKATVADIVAAAGISREAFYEHFHDKKDAFAETVKFVFEQLMAAAAGAFFGVVGPRPEKVWAAGEAYVGFVAGRPSLAHSVFVEPYAVGSDVQRGDDFLRAFTLFLEEGRSYRPAAGELPRITGEAIGGAVLEAITTYLRHEHSAELRQLVPLIAYVILAPFMGSAAASEFVERKAGQGADQTRGAPPPHDG